MSMHENRKAVITVTATTDAEGIAQNKVVSQSIEIPNAVLDEGGTSLLKSITLFDENNTTLVCDIVFSSVSTAITQDEGKAIGEDVDDLDSVLANVLGYVSLVAGDHSGMVDASVATKTGIDLMVAAASGSTSIYMHIINRGSTATFAAVDDVKVKLGIEY